MRGRQRGALVDALPRRLERHRLAEVVVHHDLHGVALCDSEHRAGQPRCDALARERAARPGRCGGEAPDGHGHATGEREGAGLGAEVDADHRRRRRAGAERQPRSGQRDDQQGPSRLLEHDFSSAQGAS